MTTPTVISTRKKARSGRVGALRVAGRVLGRVAAMSSLLWLAAGPSAPAQVIMDQPPKDLAGIDVTERRGEVVPLDIPLLDHTGAAVRFGDYFDGKRPVVFLMAYYTCPMLCGLALADLQKAVRGVKLELGKDYRVVVLSFDHRNAVADAATKHDMYVTDAIPMADSRRTPATPADDVWPFLLATEQNAKRIADSVGFAYRFIPETGEFAHPTALFVLSPAGKISNYMYGKFGSTYNEKQMRLAIMDASEGKVGSVFDKILWACYHYDPTRGTWTVQAMTVMRIGGALTAASLGALVIGLAWQRRRRVSAAAGRVGVAGAAGAVGS